MELTGLCEADAHVIVEAVILDAMNCDALRGGGRGEGGRYGLAVVGRGQGRDWVGDDPRRSRRNVQEAGEKRSLGAHSENEMGRGIGLLDDMGARLFSILASRRRR